MTTQLQGPTDPEAFREWDGRKRMYVDPLPTCPLATATDANWPSISAVKKAEDSDWTSTMVKRMAKISADEWHRIAELPFGARKDAMYSVNRQDLNIAAGRGTIVHTWGEDLLNGVPLRKWTQEDLDRAQIPVESLAIAETYREALIDFFLTYDPELVAAEYVAIHRDLNGRGYGGTPDGIWRLRKTRPGIYAFDYKTRGADAQHSVYPQEAQQVAAGVRAQYMIVDDGLGGAKRAEFPELDGGMVVTIKPDGARVFPIDLDAGMRDFTRLHQRWIDKPSDRDPIGRVWPVQRATPDQRASVAMEKSDVVGDQIRAARSRAALTVIWRDAVRAGTWRDEHSALAKSVSENFAA
jgi:hypothetical protein